MGPSEYYGIVDPIESLDVENASQIAKLKCAKASFQAGVEILISDVIGQNNRLLYC